MKTIERLFLLLFFFFSANTLVAQNTVEASLDSAQKMIEEENVIRGYSFCNQALITLKKMPVVKTKMTYETHLKYLSVVREIENRIISPNQRRLFYAMEEFDTYEKTIELAFQLYQKNLKEAYIQKAFELTERNKNVIFLQTLRGLNIQTSVPDSLLIKEGEFLAQIKSLEDSLVFYKKNLTKHKLEIDKIEKKRDKTQLEFEAFQRELKTKHTQYATFQTRKKGVPIAFLQENLKKKQAFVEYFYGDSSVYAFVFTKKEMQFLKLAPTKTIQSQITVYKNSLHRDEMAFVKVSAELYQALFAPIEPYLKGIKKVSIVADGGLSFIPFEALVTEEVNDWNYDFSNLKYLIYKYQFSYYQSATAFTHLKNSMQNIGKTAALGLAPLFTTAIKKRFEKVSMDSSYLRLNSLVQSEELFSFLQKKFKTNVLTGEQATLEGFQEYQYAPLIHFATHTLVDNTAPLQSKIALAKSDASDAGYLFLKDLYQMNLRAELVVLGSCETGRGEFNRGEGVVSLAYGFDLAGAASTVYSLWAVDETATNRLMRYFYNYLSKGLPKDEALHRAKIKCLKSADEIEASPFYWAGFVLNGETKPLERVERQPTFGWYWLMIGVVILITVSWLVSRRFSNVESEV